MPWPIPTAPDAPDPQAGKLSQTSPARRRTNATRKDRDVSGYSAYSAQISATQLPAWHAEFRESPWPLLMHSELRLHDSPKASVAGGTQLIPFASSLHEPLWQAESA